MNVVKLNSILELDKIQTFYKVNWPVHIITYYNFKNFIARFQKHPELQQDVTFLSIGNEWMTNGTFVMINSIAGTLFFDTLEPAPFAGMRELLMLVKYSAHLQHQTFINVREDFRELVLEVLANRHFKVVSNYACDCFVMPKELQEQFKELIIE